jgi:hypothetical protein
MPTSTIRPREGEIRELRVNRIRTFLGRGVIAVPGFGALWSGAVTDTGPGPVYA